MIAAILLAAGRAERFGAPKLVASTGAPDGAPVVRRAAAGLLASRVSGVVVVLGSDAAAVRGALAGLPMGFVVNDRYADGMGSSIRAGVEQVQTAMPAAAGVIVALGDQPTVGPDIVDALIARFEATRRPDSGEVGVAIVAPRYAGMDGPPVLFARALFPELLSITGDHGARGVVWRDPSRVAFVEFSQAPPRDVDTAADLRALQPGGNSHDDRTEG